MLKEIKEYIEFNKLTKLAVIMMAHVSFLFAGNPPTEETIMVNGCPKTIVSSFLFNTDAGGYSMGDGFDDGLLTVHSLHSSPVIYSPQSLSYSASNYRHITNIRVNPSSNVSLKAKVKYSGDEEYRYEFKIGESTAIPVGKILKLDNRMIMVDENFERVIENPVYLVELYRDGSRSVFDALTGQTLYYELSSGLRYDFKDANSGFELINSRGVIRQVKSSKHFLDIVVLDEFGYEIRYYEPSNVGQKSEALYTLHGDPFRTIRIENPNQDDGNINEVLVTEMYGDFEAIEEWTYNPNTKGWTALSADGHRSISKVKVTLGDGTRVELKEYRDKDGNVVLKTHKKSASYSFGIRSKVEITDPDGIALSKFTNIV